MKYKSRLIQEKLSHKEKELEKAFGSYENYRGRKIRFLFHGYFSQSTEKITLGCKALP